MNPFDIALARQDLEHEKKEQAFIEKLGEAWGDWVVHAEGAKLTPISTAQLLGIAKIIPPARGILNLDEEVLMRLDREVAHLTPRHQRIVFVEFVFSANADGWRASQEYKARHYFGCERILYRTRRFAALASWVSRLMPEFAMWQRRYE